jgi:nitrite reductase/ring-hydroxylating ferredoxin subunit
MLNAVSDLTSVAVYQRRIGASLERVWENVRDWEHLPWLHHESFASIALEEEGEFGWRARIGLRGSGAPQIRLELVLDEGECYVSRTLDGPGAASEIWTRLRPVDAKQTDIEVEFLLPDVAPARRGPLGDAYVALYTRLWDQDEAMMQRRSWLLEAPRAAPGAVEPLDVGSVAELEGRLPLRVAYAGRLVAITRIDAEWVAFDALCPHALGPLDAGEIADGRVVCPWHGYAFDVRSGRGCDGAAQLRLAPAPRVEVSDGRVRLLR